MGKANVAVRQCNLAIYGILENACFQTKYHKYEKVTSVEDPPVTSICTTARINTPHRRISARADQGAPL